MRDYLKSTITMKNKNIIFVKTILTLDDVLPLLYQLHSQGMMESPLIIAWDGVALDYLRQNVVLSNAINEMGGELTGINRYKNRWLSQFYNLWVLKKLLYSRCNLIETYPISNKLSKLLVWLNRTVWRSVCIRTSIVNRPPKLARNTVAYYEAVREDHARKNVSIVGYDYLLLSYDRTVYEDVNNVNLLTDAKVINVGYTRGLSAWVAYIGRTGHSFFQEKLDKPYFFFPLSAVEKGFLVGEDCIPMDTKLRESLGVLKNYNDKIHTVFKPHFKTNIKALKVVLEEVGYENYSISYMHPSVLMKKARFTFCYHPTSVLIDAYYYGCPTVEYAQYDSRFYQMNDSRPRYLYAIDFFSYRDKDKLCDILGLVVSKRVGVVRDPERIAEEFHVLDDSEVGNAMSFLKNH